MLFIFGKLTGGVIYIHLEYEIDSVRMTSSNVNYLKTEELHTL